MWWWWALGAAALFTVVAGGAAKSKPKPVMTMLAPQSGELNKVRVVITSLGCDHIIDTVTQLFLSAADPLRVHVALVVVDPSGGVESSTRAALESHGLYLWASNVRWHRQGTGQALGPWHARALAPAPAVPCTYELHVHAHTQFAPQWDSHLIAQHQAMADDRVVFTNHPDDAAPCYLRFAPQFDTELGLPVSDIARASSASPGLLTTALWSSRFSFAKCAVHDRVPFDAGLLGISRGADVVYAARLHAAGCVLWHPPKCWVTHLDHACARAVSGSKELARWTQASKRRLKCQLGLLRLASHSAETVQLPPVPSDDQVAAYEHWAGIDFGKLQVTPYGVWGLTPGSSAVEYYAKTGQVTSSFS